MKYFNTAGPCVPALHYMLPAEPRLPDARRFIDRGHYFTLHAPRQTGKTTTLAALARQLTTEGRYLAVHLSCETAEVAGDNYAAAEELVLGVIRREVDLLDLPRELTPPNTWPDATAGTSSPFNIKVASLRIGDFTAEEVRLLYGRHTAETGQEFSEEAVERAYDYSRGQPWLVNALAREVIEELKVWRTGTDPLHEGLRQLDHYLERLGLDHGIPWHPRRRGGGRAGSGSAGTPAGAGPFPTNCATPAGCRSSAAHIS